MNDSPVTVEHDGIVITLDERTNLWTFELRGRERKFPSLREARECIEKPEPKKKSEFKRIECWLVRYSDCESKVEVTSIADSPRFETRLEVWVSENGNRSKQYASNLFPTGDVNDRIISQMNEKRAEVAQIEKDIEGLKKTLVPLVIPKDV